MWPSTAHFLVLGLLVTFAIAVTAAPTATTLADARPMRFHFKVKRASMKMYDQTEFDVFTRPIVSADKSKIRYDGYATFMDSSSTKHSILIVDGFAYFTTIFADGFKTAECSTSSSLALLDYIIPALNEATAISSAAVGDKEITCDSGDLFKVVLGDATFVLCASGSSGFIVYGSDLDTTATYLDTLAPITAPELSDDEKQSCAVIVNPSSVTTTTLALITGKPIAYGWSTQSLSRYVGRYFSYAR